MDRSLPGDRHPFHIRQLSVYRGFLQLFNNCLGGFPPVPYLLKQRFRPLHVCPRLRVI